MQLKIRKELIYLAVAMLAVLALSVLNINTYAGTSFNQNVSTSATINTFVETSLNASTVAFGSVDPGVVNDVGDSLRITNTMNNNAAIDIFLNATNLSSGATQINNTNISVSTTSAGTIQTNFTQSVLGAYTYINGTGANAGFVEGLAADTTFDMFFFLDTPVGQASGAYTGGMTVRSVPDGTVP